MKTSDKGDIGSLSAMADLSKKGYSILTPISESLPFDLVAYKAGKFLRIQAKYHVKGFLGSTRAIYKDGKFQTRPYEKDEFDYYALYLPAIDKVVYPSIKFAGCYIRCTIPETHALFYWYEDFLEFTDRARKRSVSEFGGLGYKPRPGARKANRLSEEELKKLLWEMPTSAIAKKYGVSDKAIDKWAKRYSLDKPGRGYWAKKASVNNSKKAI